MSHPEDVSLWARSDVMPDGTYAVTLTVGGDRAWTLTTAQAIAYAVLCVRRAVEAEHDAATLAMLRAAGVPPADIGLLIAIELRPVRPADDKATAPLAFVPGTSSHGVPFIVVELDGESVGRITPAQLRDHAVGVLMAVAAVDLDAVLCRVLAVDYELGAERARVAVSTLADHWPGAT